MKSGRFYSFEVAERPKRVVDEDDPGLRTFVARLGLHAEVVDACLPELKEFARHVIHNIEWYHGKLAAEASRKRRFFALTLALAAVLPVATTIIGVVLKDLDALAYGLAAGLLSGAIGIQRSLSSWFKHRKVGAVFAEAAAELKEVLYELEDRWADDLGGRLTRGFVDPDGQTFLDDLGDSAQLARRIVSAERVRFYVASAPVLSLRERTPAVGEIATTGPPSDVRTRGSFTFKRGAFNDEEVETLLQNHALARACVDGCACLDEVQKADLRERYTRRIHHYTIEKPGVYAQASVGRSRIGINKELLLGRPDEEIAQTLIHEMMHCAGYRHPRKTEDDKPGDGGPYYSSPPLLAETCIAGVQSDLADAAGVGVLACDGAHGICEVGPEEVPA